MNNRWHPRVTNYKSRVHFTLKMTFFTWQDSFQEKIYIVVDHVTSQSCITKRCFDSDLLVWDSATLGSEVIEFRLWRALWVPLPFGVRSQVCCVWFSEWPTSESVSIRPRELLACLCCFLRWRTLWFVYYPHSPVCSRIRLHMGIRHIFRVTECGSGKHSRASGTPHQPTGDKAVGNSSGSWCPEEHKPTLKSFWENAVLS